MLRGALKHTAVHLNHITWSNTAQFPMTAKKRWKYFSDCSNLRKQPTFRDVATDFPAKWRLRNECRNSTLMTCHYPVLESTSDWLLSVPREKFASTIQKHYKNLGTVTGHQYGICALVFGRSFPRATIAGNKWKQFSNDNGNRIQKKARATTSNKHASFLNHLQLRKKNVHSTGQRKRRL